MYLLATGVTSSFLVRRCRAARFLRWLLRMQGKRSTTLLFSN